MLDAGTGERRPHERDLSCKFERLDKALVRVSVEDEPYLVGHGFANRPLPELLASLGLEDCTRILDGRHGDVDAIPNAERRAERAEIGGLGLSLADK